MRRGTKAISGCTCLHFNTLWKTRMRAYMDTSSCDFLCADLLSLVENRRPVSSLPFLQIALDFRCVALIVCAPKCHLADQASISAPSEIILAPSGHLDGPWEHQKGHLGVPSGICIDFAWISGSHFESLWVWDVCGF